MKLYISFFVLLTMAGLGMANGQNVHYLEKLDYKSRWYIYWGWNLDGYSDSDIHFKGDDYDFTLQNVAANDRQTPFEARTYCNPLRATIPQYNFRVGYFLNNHYNVSFGIDHMKYVMQQKQIVGIDGFINNSETQYDGLYENDEILLAADFLRFEHTDGLNYVNTELRRMDNLFAIGPVKVNAVEGISAGFLWPKTNCTLLNNERYDEFHIAGFGTGILAGINVELYQYFFLQSELKGGYINMPSIRTTAFESDIADQQFFFAQWNVVFGVNFNLH